MAPKPVPFRWVTLKHGLINSTDTEAKCRHLKKLTCEETLSEVFIRVYRLEIQSVMFVFFDPALSTVALLTIGYKFGL